MIDAVHHSFPHYIFRSIHRFSIISWAPAAAVNGDILESEIEGRCFVDGSNRTTEDADACYLGFKCNAYSAYFVSSRSDLASATCSVMISSASWSWKSYVGIKIMG